MNLVCRVGVPDDELAVLGGGDEVSAVRRPVHGVDLGQMALEGALRLHRQARQRLDPLLRDIADCTARVSNDRGGAAGAAGASRTGAGHVRVVSASSSFFRFILSLSASASRRAVWIFCWIDSAFISAMLRGQRAQGAEGASSRMERRGRTGEIQGPRGRAQQAGLRHARGQWRAEQQWAERRARGQQLRAQSWGVGGEGGGLEKERPAAEVVLGRGTGAGWGAKLG